MECHGISGILGSKAITKRDSKLRLILWLEAREENAMVHRDACSLSSLNA